MRWLAVFGFLLALLPGVALSAAGDGWVELTPGMGLPTLPTSRGAQQILGTDERVRVSPTTGAPWRSIAFLVMQSPGGVASCTGTFIAANLLITAAHCLYDGTDATRVIVVPGMDGTAMPYGWQDAGAWWVPPQWRAGDATYDYALILMPSTTLGSSVGWLYLWAFSDPTLSGSLSFVISGYPGDKSPSVTNAQQWFSTKNGLLASTASLVAHDADTESGQSGAALWRVSDRAVFAIHNGALSSGINYGRRITQAAISDMLTACNPQGCSFLYGVEATASPTPTATPTQIPATATPTPSPTPGVCSAYPGPNCSTATATRTPIRVPTLPPGWYRTFYPDHLRATGW